MGQLSSAGAPPCSQLRLQYNQCLHKPYENPGTMRADLAFDSAELEAEFGKLQTERNLRLTKQVGR